MESKYVCYDIDGTLAKGMLFIPLYRSEYKEGFISSESFERINSLLAMYKSGKLQYEDAVQVLLEAHATAITGVDVKQLDLHTESFIRTNSELFRPFGKKVIEIFKTKDFRQIAVTAEPDYVASAVAKFIGIDGIESSMYEVNNGKYTGKVAKTLADRTAKSEAISHYSIEFAFGDSEGDSEMLELAKYPFCIEPTKGLMEIADRNNWKVYTDDLEVISDVNTALDQLASGSHQL